MSFFKKFSVVLVGFCSLMGITQLLRTYMNYSFSEEDALLGTVEKIKIFLSPEATGEPRHFALFVGLMVLLFVVSLVFHKLPIIPLIVAPFPLISSFILFFDGVLDKDDFFYILCLAIGLAGALYESLLADREKGRMLTHKAAAVVGSSFAWLPLRLSFIADLTVSYADDPSTRTEAAAENAAQFELFGVDLFEAITPENTKFFTLLGILVIVSVVISLIFRGAYFIDLGFSAFLLIFTVIKWHAEVLTHSEAPILGLAIIYFVFRLAIFFGEPLPKKRIAPDLPTEQNL